MSRIMGIVRKAMGLSKKSVLTKMENSKTKKKEPIKDVIVAKDYFRGLNQFLEKFVVRGTFHNIVDIAGIKCHRLGINSRKKYFSKTEINNSKLLFYIHGGGFCRGFPLHGVYYMKAMMKRLGCEAVAVDYSLSPEVVYPTALNEIVSVYKQLICEYKPEDIIVTGESAGANLTLALLMYLRDNNLPLPSCGVLISGYFNLNNDAPSYEINREKDISLTKEIIDLMAQTYLAGDYCDLPHPLAQEPYVSPTNGNFDGLPPLMFTVCTDEILYDDTAQAYAKAKAKNSACILYTDQKCFHAYPVLGDVCLESKKACNEIEKFIKALY